MVPPPSVVAEARVLSFPGHRPSNPLETCRNRVTPGKRLTAPAPSGMGGMPQDFPTAREHPSDAGIYRLYAEDSLAAVGSRQLFSNAKGVTSILDQPWNPS